MKKGKLIGSIIIFLLILGVFFNYYVGFQLKGEDKVELSYGEVYEEKGVSVNVLFFSLNKYVKIENKVNENKIGTYEIFYKMPFKTLKRTVVIKDKTAPTITLKGEDAIYLSLGNVYEEEGYEALDDIDGDVTSKVQVTSDIDYNQIGIYEIVYEVEDAMHNKSKVIRTIHVKDDIAPTLELKGSTFSYIKIGETYKEEGYTASDNYDGNLTKKVKVTSHVNYQQVGTYEIVYEVEDSFQNKTTKKRTISVIQKNEFTYINGILLVNKTHPIPSTYAPGVNSEAFAALKKLQEAAQNNGFNMPLLSGYRSYNDQTIIYNNYVKRDGEEKANTYSAKPGQSEHQTGLAFDVGDIDNSYGETEAGKWLSENAHHYGFIIRYPKGKEAITGYQYEPWHIRYLNVEVATDIYNKQVTLEEYLGV